ncbi:MAG: ABC transporter ATP-binding protein [Nitrospira sp.]|nr:ABC transporter ATP-binding protein [Nitrospira sp.]
MITVQHVSKHYGRHTALDDVTFHVKQGEILAFLGPNGAGKTTTMRILTCFLPQSEGMAKVAGFDCLDEPIEVKRRIGYLPETPPLYPELTVDEYLTFVGRLKRLAPRTLALRKSHVIDQVGLSSVHHRVIGHLSRGYRQRVGLAQALIHDPPVLILDEPTVGLDPKQIIEIRGLIKSLAGSHTVILSTHILPEAMATCDRVVIIDRGRIVAEDSPDRLSSGLRQSEKMSLTVKQPGADWLERLRMLPGVLGVLPTAEPNTCTIDCQLGRDLRETLSQFVVSQGYGLLELTPLSLSLEEVFLQLTRREGETGTGEHHYRDAIGQSGQSEQRPA